MLHHCNPAVIGFLDKFGLAFFNVFEVQFLEFFLLGVDCRAGECTDRTALTFRCRVVALQLVVGVCCNFRTATIVNFMRYPDQVAAASKGINLRHLDATTDGFEAQLHSLAVGLQFSCPLDSDEARLVIWKIGADQAALRHVLVFRLEQREGFFLVTDCFVFGEVQSDDVTAECRNGGREKIGFNAYELCLDLCDGCRLTTGNNRFGRR